MNVLEGIDGEPSEVTLRPWCWLMTDGLANSTWNLSMSRATSLGVDQHDGHLDPLAADELLLGPLHVGAELGDGLIDGVEGVVADLGLAGSHAVGMLA